MTHPVTLTIPFHDPEASQLGLLSQMLPKLQALFSCIVADVSPETDERSVALLRDVCAFHEQVTRDFSPEGIVQAGKFRRNLLAMALKTDSPHFMYCDGDRVLHWMAHYPDELAEVVRRIPEHDFTVLGRTPRAFDSHSRVQTETERIANEVFARISGHAWDVTAAARGISRAAAQWIVDESKDNTFGVDASWPLLVQRAGRFSMCEIQTEGLEFETAEKHGNQRDAWIAAVNDDPNHWIMRLNLARMEVQSMLPYWNEDSERGRDE